MRKIYFIFVLFLVILFLLLFLSADVLASDNVAGKSASMAAKKTFVVEKKQEINLKIVKKMTIKKVLETYQSALKDQVDVFVDVCFKYDLDCYLLPAITGVESTFGRFVYPSSYNPFGWGGGYIIFSSWKEAIETVALKLKINYIDRGYNTVEKIAPIYAESPTWSQKVNYFKKIFEDEERKIDLLILKNTLE